MRILLIIFQCCWDLFSWNSRFTFFGRAKLESKLEGRLLSLNFHFPLYLTYVLSRYTISCWFWHILTHAEREREFNCICLCFQIDGFRLTNKVLNCKSAMYLNRIQCKYIYFCFCMYFETNKQKKKNLVERREECSANIETGITKDSYFLPVVGSRRAARARLSWRPRAACTSIVSGEFVQCSNFSINPNNCIKAA